MLDLVLLDQIPLLHLLYSYELSVRAPFAEANFPVSASANYFHRLEIFNSQSRPPRIILKLLFSVQQGLLLQEVFLYQVLFYVVHIQINHFLIE